MKNFFIVAVSALFFAGAAFAQSSGGNWDSRLMGVKGQVFVKPQGGKWYAAKQGVPLLPGDAIKTGTGGSADISFDANGIVRLFPSSSIEMESLSKQASVVRIVAGVVVGKFTGLSAKSYIVMVAGGNSNVTVRDAEFGSRYMPKSRVFVAGVYGAGSLLPSAMSANGLSPALTEVTRGKEVQMDETGSKSEPRVMKVLQAYRGEFQMVSARFNTAFKSYTAYSEEEAAALRKKLLGKVAVAAKEPDEEEDTTAPAADNSEQSARPHMKTNSFSGSTTKHQQDLRSSGDGDDSSSSGQSVFGKNSIDFSGKGKRSR